VWKMCEVGKKVGLRGRLKNVKSQNCLRLLKLNAKISGHPRVFFIFLGPLIFKVSMYPDIILGLFSLFHGPRGVSTGHFLIAHLAMEL